MGEAMIAFSPEILLALIAMILLVTGVFKGDQSSKTIVLAAALAIFLIGVLTLVLMLGKGTDEPSIIPALFGGQVKIDAFSQYFKLLILLNSSRN